MGPDRPVAAFTFLIIFNYFSVMSSANVFSLKMSFYSVLRFEVNQGRFESSLMMLHTGTSQCQGTVLLLAQLKLEVFTRFT